MAARWTHHVSHRAFGPPARTEDSAIDCWREAAKDDGILWARNRNAGSPRVGGPLGEPAPTASSRTPSTALGKYRRTDLEPLQGPCKATTLPLTAAGRARGT